MHDLVIWICTIASLLALIFYFIDRGTDNGTPGWLLLVLSIGGFSFAVYLYMTQEKPKPPNPEPVQINLIKYNSILEEADNELRKTPPNYVIALGLYNTAYNIGQKGKNIDTSKAKQGITKCEKKLLVQKTEKTKKDNIKEESVRKVGKEETLNINYPITMEFLTGKFEPSENPFFVRISDEYIIGDTKQWLHKHAYDAFKKMYDFAQKEGIELKILSATRNFDSEKFLWEKKWNEIRARESSSKMNIAFETLEYCSIPGLSRHHWGTDIDFLARNNNYFEKGIGLKTYNWLVKNAPLFGFCQPYNKKNPKRPSGYDEKKWQWTYMPVSVNLTKQVKLRMVDEMLSDFIGADMAIKIGFVEKFAVDGINTECL